MSLPSGLVIRENFASRRTLHPGKRPPKVAFEGQGSGREATPVSGACMTFGLLYRCCSGQLTGQVFALRKRLIVLESHWR